MTILVSPGSQSLQAAIVTAKGSFLTLSSEPPHVGRQGRTVRLLLKPGGLRARRRSARCRAWPTASAWKWVAAMDTTSALMRSTKYSAATLRSTHVLLDIGMHRR